MDRPTPTGPAAPDLRIVESRVYRGGNIWSYDPSIHLVVDLGVLEGYPTDTLPGFTDRLLELLPGLENHTCSKGVRGGFVERLREGTWLGHVAEHVALQLQQEAGHDQRRGKTRDGQGPPGRLQRHLRLHRRGGRPSPPAGWRCASSTTSSQAEDGLRLRRPSSSASCTRAERTAFGPSTGGHPRGGGEPRHPLHPAQQRQPRAARPGRAPAAHPRHDDVEDRRARRRHRRRQGHDHQAARLGRAARCPSRRRCAPPTAPSRRPGGSASPSSSSRSTATTGVGCASTCMSDDEVHDGLRRRQGRVPPRHVIVESFVTGRDYRCLIVGGRMQAIAERVPAHVIGDGTHTVARARRDHQRRPAPRRRPREGADQDPGRRRRRWSCCASRASPSTTCRPPATMVKLALTGNMSTGGISIDRTFDAHPDNVEIAEEAARLIGLDVAGIDFICPDIASPVRETGGAICEVNAAPGLPDAHAPDRRRAAVHRQARRRPALPARARRRGCRSSP